MSDPPPIPPPPPPGPLDTSAQDSRNSDLAAQRRLLNAKRIGRSALVLDRTSGISATGSGGLRIP